MGIKINSEVFKKIIKLTLFFATTLLFHSQNKTLSDRDLIKTTLEIQSADKIRFDSIKKIDFINYNYKYLDVDYQITATSDDFEKSLVQNRFYKNTIRNYSDSLSVVLMLEFGDWQVMNIAKSRIVFSWKKLSMYLYKEESDLKKIAAEINMMKHPYLLYNYFKSPEESNVKNREMERLRKILSSKLGISMSVLKLKRNIDLLELCYKNHPEVIQIKEALDRKHIHQN